VSQGNFKTFQDLDVWKAARELRKKIYAAIKQLPEHEKYNAASQMRRAALSVTNNIAEGHGRYHYQENIQFLRQSRGSLEELLDDMTLCADQRYLSDVEIKAIENEIGRVRALLNAYVRYLRERKEAAPTVSRETANAYITDGEDTF
jgi:four helix bundle protein